MDADVKPSPLGDQIRKLAAAVRAKGDNEKVAQLKTAAHVLRAAKGLTLLRERVR